MNRTNFQSLIRRILNEEKERIKNEKNQYLRLPEVVHDKDYAKIVPHKSEGKCKDDLLKELDKVVHEIDPSYMVVWDDHDDISITGRDIHRIRVIPRWENNYDLEIMTRNDDRIYISAQQWEQVKDIVKDNLKSGSETNMEKAYGKNAENRKDQVKAADKDLSQKDKPKILPLTNEPPAETKNKDKDYTEDQTKAEDDLPEKPMKEVGEFKKQSSYKVKDPVKLRKRKPDTKLVIKQS